MDTDPCEGSELQSEKYPPGWTEGDVERLVGRVSQRVIENFYQEVGRSVVKRILQFIGWAAVVGLTWFAATKGKQWLQ